MTSDISILLIEKDKTIKNIIRKFFEKKEYKLHITDSFNDSLNAIVTHNFKIVIISDSIDSMEFETIVNKIKVSYPDTMLILLLKEMIENTSFENIFVFYKPVNLIKLEERIKEKLKAHVNLNFKNQDLFDFINQNAKINQNLLISILDPMTRKLGLIYLSGFNFIHSEYDDLIGDDAFYSILDIDQGLVSYFEGIEPPVITMNFALDKSHLSNNEVYKKEEPLSIPVQSNPIPIVQKIEFTNFDQNNNNSVIDRVIDKNEPSTKKIIIVDDDMNSRKITADILSKGHEVADIEKTSITEFIKLITLSNQKNIVSVKDSETNKIGFLYIDNDMILHARYNNLVGSNAFYQIMEIKHGKLEQIPWAQPKEITINATITALLKAKDILKKDELINKVVENKIDDIKPTSDTNKSNIKKILIVDDDTSSIKILSSYLQKKGYQTQVTDSALKGIEILKRESFNVVITDVNMPDMNGIEFLLWIKQYFHKIKVIMITAFGSETVKSLSSQKGAFYFFDKPINFKEMDYLLNAIHSSENFSQDINLIDFIKLSAVSKANKLIAVTSLLTNNTGYIYLNKGRFLHVEFSTFKGQEALEKILTTNNLIFSEITWVEPTEKNLDMDAIRVLEAFSDKAENKEIAHDSEKESSAKEVSLVNSESKDIELYRKQKEIITQIEKETDPIKKLTIYENGICMGIIVGVSTKDQVLKNMANLSKENMTSQKDSKMLIYDDISVTILFDDNNIVQEMNFGKFFKGKTSKGIQIDDFMKKGFESYGKPDMCTLKGAVWKNISLFSFDGRFVTSIRLRPLN